MTTITRFIDSRAVTVANGASLIYKGTIVDENRNPINPLSTLSLSIVDTKTGNVINGVDQVNILNTDRGSIDSSGRLTVTLIPEDTESEVSTMRSLVLDWEYGPLRGRHQVDFRIVALIGD